MDLLDRPLHTLIWSSNHCDSPAARSAGDSTDGATPDRGIAFRLPGDSALRLGCAYKSVGADVSLPGNKRRRERRFLHYARRALPSPE